MFNFFGGFMKVNKTLLNEWEDKKSMEDYENFFNENPINQNSI